jgi:hypothetical protein
MHKKIPFPAQASVAVGSLDNEFTAALLHYDFVARLEAELVPEIPPQGNPAFMVNCRFHRTPTAQNPAPEVLPLYHVAALIALAFRTPGAMLSRLVRKMRVVLAHTAKACGVAGHGGAPAKAAVDLGQGLVKMSQAETLGIGVKRRSL